MDMLKFYVYLVVETALLYFLQYNLYEKIAHLINGFENWTIISTNEFYVSDTKLCLPQLLGFCNINFNAVFVFKWGFNFVFVEPSMILCLGFILMKLKLCKFFLCKISFMTEYIQVDTTALSFAMADNIKNL